MSGSESNGTNPGEDVQNLPRAPISAPKLDPRYKTPYGKMVGSMKSAGQHGGLCCEREVDPYDPDQRPHKERSSVQALSASVRLRTDQSGQRKALRQSGPGCTSSGASGPGGI